MSASFSDPETNLTCKGMSIECCASESVALASDSLRPLLTREYRWKQFTTRHHISSLEKHWVLSNPVSGKGKYMLAVHLQTSALSHVRT